MSELNNWVWILDAVPSHISFHHVFHQPGLQEGIGSPLLHKSCGNQWRSVWQTCYTQCTKDHKGTKAQATESISSYWRFVWNCWNCVFSFKTNAKQFASSAAKEVHAFKCKMQVGQKSQEIGDSRHLLETFRKLNPSHRWQH